MDIRQSEIYVKYVVRNGWIVEEIDGVKIFIKKFPLFGSVIKIHRPDHIPQSRLLDELVKKYKARSVSLELNKRARKNHGFAVNQNPYLPTKTIQIDLIESEEKIL